MTQETSAIFEKVVYTQPTEPADKRESVVWIDTSNDPPMLKTYGTSGFQSVIPVETSQNSYTREIQEVISWNNSGDGTYTFNLSEPIDIRRFRVTNNNANLFYKSWGVRQNGSSIESGDFGQVNGPVTSPMFPTVVNADQISLEFKLTSSYETDMDFRIATGTDPHIHTL